MSLPRKRSCTNKVRFTTRKDARSAKRQMQGRGYGREGHITPYECDYCGFWHLGHLSPSVFRGVISKDAWRDQ